MSPLNYDPLEVEALEQSTLAGLAPDAVITDNYFKEIVAKTLYAAWTIDHTDTRLLTYTLPLINSLIVKYLDRVRAKGLEQSDVFNDLAIKVQTLGIPKFTPGRGRLFTFLNIFVTFRLLDMLGGSKYRTVALEDWDSQVDDESAHTLADFISFLGKLKACEGPTANRMIDALIRVITGPEPVASLPQQQIIRRVSQFAHLPLLIVEPYYLTILRYYKDGTLPKARPSCQGMCA